MPQRGPASQQGLKLPTKRCSKVLHHNKEDVWSEFKYKADYSPFVYAGDYDRKKKPISHPDVPAPFRTNRIVDGLNMGGGFIDGSYGPMKNFGEQKFNGERLSSDTRL